jgi:hypothetical protein
VITSLNQSALILWDIDHTLVAIGEVSREIYEKAFEEVVGQPLGLVFKLSNFMSDSQVSVPPGS